MCQGRSQGWGQGGLLIDEAMPMYLGECFMLVHHSRKDTHAHTHMNIVERIGREDRGGGVNVSGHLIWRMSQKRKEAVC